ncbi:MAG: peptidoglycan editing factor PgeF [Gammaproteobacteria bacterium]|nr:peptidoglycan editing factor PgeF [Gammaproteobacteria bacterium]
MDELILPDWPAPPGIGACMSTRCGGWSQGAYRSLNLGDHVGDQDELVTKNRERLQQIAGMPTAPRWLSQLHGSEVVRLDNAPPGGRISADGAITATAGQICVVMTADCLPLLLTTRDGSEVAAVHGGWRSLQQGIIAAALHQFSQPSTEVMAWLGVAIGPEQFEVGEEVRSLFMAQHSDNSGAFRPGERAGKWFADIYALARGELLRLGVTAIYGGGGCTFTDRDRFFSYRRQNCTGRMASAIWIDPERSS